MTAAFPRWQDALSAATTDDARRALLGEVALWRATHLIDVVGQRDAAWTTAQLHRALGDNQAALREARSLASLCQTPPAAADAELDAADALVRELGGSAPPRKKKRKEPRERAPAGSGGRKGVDGAASQGQRGRRAPELSVFEQAVVHGERSEYGDAFRVLRGKGGPRTQLIRAWLDLKKAIEGPDDQRGAALAKLLSRLHGTLPEVPGSSGKSAPATPSEPPPEPTSRVGRLLGRAVPHRRAKVLRAMQQFLDHNPAKADALAAAALLDHKDESGEAPGPWLAGFVAQAIVDDGPETKAAMATLAEAGSVALAIYDESPFTLLLDAWRDARSRGLGMIDLRRGVLRTEPEDRRIWTLRIHQGGVDGLLAVAPAAEAPLEEGLAADLAKRLRGLCDRVVLVAEGAGNAALRAGAAALDVSVVDSASALGQLQAAIQAAPPPPAATAPATPRSEPRAPSAERKPAEPTRSKAPSHADRVAQVQAALTATPVPTPEQLEPLVGPIKRVRDVLELAEGLQGADAAERLRVLVLALHRTAPERVRLLQATTMLLRAAAQPGGEALGALITEGEPSVRLGGPGATTVVAVAKAVQGAGWQLERVLRGVTRRERREHKALDVLADHLDPLWRVIVDRAGVRGEIWVAHNLPPEGQAGLPQLALRESPRVGVVGDGLAESWVAVGGPPLVDVTGLAAALEGWTAT